MLIPLHSLSHARISVLGPSLARASALLMLLFTERYYRSCAARAGLPSWPGPSAGVDLILRSFGAFWSGDWADREMRRIERGFLAQVRRSGESPTASA